MGWLRTVSPRDWLCVGIILIVAAPLYLIGIDWGMPNNQFGDEWAVLNSTLMLPYRNGDPQLYFYGVPYMYLYGLVIGIIYSVQWVLGWVSSPEDFAVAFLRDPTLLLVTGRALSALFATSAAILLYALSRHFMKAIWSLGVTLVTMLGGGFVAYAHYAKTDQMLVFMFLLVVMLMIHASASKKRLVIAIALAGASVACKLPAICLALPILVCLLYDLGGIRKALRHPLFWLSPLIMMAGFVIVNPWAVIRFDELMRELTLVDKVFGEAGARNSLIDNVTFYLGILSGDRGYLGPALILASPLILAFKPSRERVILLAAAWALIPLVLLLSHRDAHWTLPATPLLLLSGFILINDMLRQWLSRWHGWIMASLVMLLVVPSGLARIRQLENFQLPFTMDAAKAWIEQTIPAGTAIAMDTGRYLPIDAPALRQDPVRLAEITVEEQSAPKDSVSGGQLDHYYRMLTKANEGLPTYRIYPILHGILWKTSTIRQRNTLKSLDEYRSLGVRYIITSSTYSVRYPPLADRLDECHPFVADYVRFYRVLPTLPMVARFEPMPGEVRGPVISIYRLDPVNP